MSVLLDTNVLVYLHDTSAPAKQLQAWKCCKRWPAPAWPVSEVTAPVLLRAARAVGVQELTPRLNELKLQV